MRPRQGEKSLGCYSTERKLCGEARLGAAGKADWLSKRHWGGHGSRPQNHPECGLDFELAVRPAAQGSWARPRPTGQRPGPGIPGPGVWKGGGRPGLEAKEALVIIQAGRTGPALTYKSPSQARGPGGSRARFALWGEGGPHLSLGGLRGRASPAESRQHPSSWNWPVARRGMPSEPTVGASLKTLTLHQAGSSRGVGVSTGSATVSSPGRGRRAQSTYDRTACSRGARRRDCLTHPQGAPLGR